MSAAVVEMLADSAVGSAAAGAVDCDPGADEQEVSQQTIVAATHA